MKAAFYDHQGKPRDVLQVGLLPDPTPPPGHVRVQVAVSGLNPTDLKSRSGFAGAVMPFPQIVPHQDGAGVIDQVGEGVPTSRIGERVWVYEAQTGRAGGTAAQYTVVPTTQAVHLPDDVSFETAACLGIPALTAHRCLFADGDIRGKRVLVHGGAGAVGTAAILLAKWAGAWVATTISRPAQADVAKALGADLILNRHETDVAASVRAATADAGVDRIVDVDLIANLNTDLACLANSGVISAYATETPTATLTVPFLSTMFRGFVFRFVFVYTMPAEAKAAAVAGVSACLASGKYRPHIGLTVPLSQIAEAHEALEGYATIGKILVTVDPV